MGLLGILAAFFSQECETSQPKKIKRTGDGAVKLLITFSSSAC